MSLSQFKPETLTVKTKNVSFEVRGLSFTDLSSLIRTHYTDLEALFELYERDSIQGQVTNMAVARYGTALVKDAPGLVAHVIAMAADEPEMVNQASRLPLLAQVDALKKIGQLTFEEVGSVKKMVEMLADLTKSLRAEKA